MNDEILSWNSEDYTSAEEKEKAIKQFKEQLEIFFKESSYTYDEYKAEREEFIEAIKKHFLDSVVEDGIYVVKNKFSSDVQTNYDAMFKHPFKTAFDAIEYIKANQNNIPEEFKKIMWWEIDKYEISDPDYVCMYSVLLDINCNIIELYSRCDEEDMCRYSQEQKNVLEWYKKLDYGKSKYNKVVQYPYLAGDIIRISNRPFEDSYSYVVYTGYGRDCIEEGVHDELVGFHFLSFLYHTKDFHNKLLSPEDITVVESCPNKLMTAISNYLKNNPTYYTSLSVSINGEYYQLKDKVNEFASSLLSPKEKLLLNKIDKTMTLDEYNATVETIKEMFVDRFTSPLDLDEVYYLEGFIQDDEPRWHKALLNSYDDVRKHIKEYNLHAEENTAEENISVCFWLIERRKLIDNEYKTVMLCETTVDGEHVVGFRVKDIYTKVYEDHSLYNAMKIVNLRNDEWDDFFSQDYGINIELPFEIGDIICVDKTPLKDPFHVVYVGKFSSLGKTTHYCLRRREWGDFKLTREMLSHPFSFDKEGNSYFPFMTKVNTCNDEALVRASAVLKCHPCIANNITSTGVSISGPDEIEEMINRELDAIRSKL